MVAHEEPSPEALRIAADIRPAMTSLYVAYFRNAESSDLTGPQLSVLHRLGFTGPHLSLIHISEPTRPY